MTRQRVVTVPGDRRPAAGNLILVTGQGIHAQQANILIIISMMMIPSRTRGIPTRCIPRADSDSESVWQCYCDSFLSSAKFFSLSMISMDHGTFVFILLFVGFKNETDVGINESSVPIRFRNAFRASRFEGSDLMQFYSFFFFSKVSTEDSDG